ncbi:uncharacterized protein LOC62_05G007745 [Vanrija pseudolonga]|uniref:Uncharacterized protein n=1 Tax=Vanrija pseudolonga TaxID=143232 RepID=A0AAF1BT19_9TREE|nr:hypothetical protein LOC62_05G007745 [Vanrija pseudolonga]
MASYPHTSLTVERLKALDASQWRQARSIVADFVDAHMECGLSARVEYDLDLLQAEVMAKVPLHADCVEAGREHYARFSPRASSDSEASFSSWTSSAPSSPSSPSLPAPPRPMRAVLRPCCTCAPSPPSRPAANTHIRAGSRSSAAVLSQPPLSPTGTAHARALAAKASPAVERVEALHAADVSALNLRLAASEEANRSLRAQLAELQGAVARAQLRADKSERERAELEGVIRRQRAGTPTPLHLRLALLTLLALCGTTLAAPKTYGPYPIIPAKGANCRHGGNLFFPVKKTYKQGEKVRLVCQTLSTDAVNGNNIWDYTTDGCWVSDALVRTGTTKFVAPDCQPYD